MKKIFTKNNLIWGVTIFAVLHNNKREKPKFNSLEEEQAYNRKQAELKAERDFRDDERDRKNRPKFNPGQRYVRL